jgi:hypothetical protein
MRHHQELFDRIHSHLGMYFIEESYSIVAAFIMGYDLAYQGGLLNGFREWLILKVNGCNNLSWEELVLQIAFPDSKSPRELLKARPNLERQAIDMLFALLAEFDEVRSKYDSLKDIFFRYQQWIEVQEQNDWKKTGP